MDKINALLLDDAERHPLIVGSSDWDEIITPALQQYGESFPSILTIPPQTERLLFVTLRCIIESVYVLGYRRGKTEAKMPQFVVAEEVE